MNNAKSSDRSGSLTSLLSHLPSTIVRRCSADNLGMLSLTTPIYPAKSK
jgi:hypothetical protein